MVSGIPSKLRRLLSPLRRRLRRSRVALRYLRGDGIEIGALHEPTALPFVARVRYVDRLPKDDLCRRFPSLPRHRIVETDIVTDGFLLDGIEDASQDFVIANHVLEHAPEALGTALRWFRAVRAGGHLLITVPIADRCFDRGRPITETTHFLEDHRLLGAGQTEAFWEKSRLHYAEWVRISVPAILLEEAGSAGLPAPADEEIERRFTLREDIHFHTFTAASFKGFLELLPSMAPEAEVVEVRPAGAEVIGVVRKRKP